VIFGQRGADSTDLLQELLDVVLGQRRTTLADGWDTRPILRPGSSWLASSGPAAAAARP
jgi:hypothetical protein